MRVMDRYPVTIAIGAGLLGWIAGDMAVTDVVTKDWVNANAKFLHWIVPAVMAGVGIAIGKMLAARKLAVVKPIIDLADEDNPRK